MVRIVRILFILLVCLAVTNLRAFAQDNANLVTVGLGMADGVGSSKPDAGLGFVFHLAYGHNMGRRFQLGLDFLNANFGARQTGQYTSAEYSAATIEGRLRYNFNPESPNIWYSSAGGGCMIINQAINSGTSSTASQNTEGSFSFSVGMEHTLNEMWTFGLEGRYLQAWSSKVQGLAIVANLGFGL